MAPHPRKKRSEPEDQRPSEGLLGRVREIRREPVTERKLDPEEKLDNEAAVLDLLVSALARRQTNDAMWEQLHDAALRDDRLAELGFAYEKLSEVERALPHAKELLKKEPAHPAARAIARELLGHKGVAARAATALFGT